MKNKYNLKIIFDNIKFKNKIILITLIVALIISTVSFLVSQYSSQKYNSLLYEQTANSLSFFSNELTNNMKTITNLSHYIATDATIQKNLLALEQSESKSLEYLSAIQKIREVIYRYSSSNIICITVVPNSGSDIMWGSDSSSEAADILDYAKKVCDKNNGTEAWVSSKRDDESILCVRQIRKVQNLSLKKLGYVIIRVDLKNIIEHIVYSKYYDNHPYTICIHNNSQLIYNREIENPAALLNKITNAKQQKYIIQKINNETMFIIHTALLPKTLNWTMTLGISYESVFHSVIFSNTLYIISIVFAFFFSVLLSGFLVRSTTYHFNTLVSKMTRLRAGNFEVMTTKKRVGNDELGLLNQYFDEMTLEFKQMIDDNYVKQMLIAQAQLKSLEQQINPHFLYNTLESINWFAKRSGERNISIMVEALSVLLRNNLSEQEDVIPLEKELHVVRSYIQIQQIRFSDNLTVEFDVDTDILNILIPKMTIQPLVENAIIHAHEEMIEECLITIRIKKKSEHVLIAIENNGPEIDTHILEHLRNRSVLPKGNGIGLTNIDSRIKIIFGEEYGLTFENTDAKTIVMFEIPLSNKKDSEEGEEKC